MGFLDSLFAPLRVKVSPTKSAGGSGTAVIGGYIASFEQNQALSGLAKYKTYGEMLANVSIVAAATRYFLAAVAKPDWKWQPPEGSGPAGEDAAELMEDVVSKMERSWHRVVRSAALYKFYGFSWQEWTAGRREDGAIGLRSVAVRPQGTIERWDLDENYSVQGVVQRSPQNYRELYVPRYKSLYMVDDALTDSPEGLGLLRQAAEHSRTLERYEQLEGIGFEVDLRGVPIGRAPLQELLDDPKLSDQDREAKIAHLKTFLSQHIRGPKLGLLLDSITYESKDESGAASAQRKWDMELLTAAATSAAEMGAAIQRKNREIARVFGLEKLLLGETGAGSLAMSRDKSDSFFMVAAETLKEIKQQVARDIVAPVMTMNGVPEEAWPEPLPDAIDQRTIEEITAALSELAKAGAPLAPNDPVVDEVRTRMGLSRAITVDIAADASLSTKEPTADEPPADEGPAEE